MSVFTPLGITIFSMLIAASLQLVPGIFSLVQHNLSGKYSRKRASNHSVFFILGTETSTALTFLVIYLIVSALTCICPIYNNQLFIWIASGILLAYSTLAFFLYYRKGNGSELFISRRLANSFHQKAQLVKSRSDAFILGAISPIPELLFTLPLYIIMSIFLTEINISCFGRATVIITYAIFSVLPLLIMHLSAPNLARTLRFRFKNKTFFKIILSICYILIALTIIMETLQ